VLLASSVVMMLPFVWMLLTSFKSNSESLSIPPKWIPEVKYYLKGSPETEVVVKERGKQGWAVEVRSGTDRGKIFVLPPDQVQKRRWLWENYVKAWKFAPFGIYFFNSVLTAVVITLSQVFTSALAAYAFAKLRFPLKNALFMVLVATLMVPSQVVLIPNYILLSKLGLIDTYAALVVPFLASVFGIYFLRQHFETIPQDLFDAAKIDGCTHWQVLTKIVFPLSQSVVLSTGLLTFIGNWNSLLWPLIVTNSPKMRTLQVGLAVFNQDAGTFWPLLMAASTFSLAPLIILFFLTQKTFIEGVTGSGLKE
jgi:multiple sugar transport system permease protein